MTPGIGAGGVGALGGTTRRGHVAEAVGAGVGLGGVGAATVTGVGAAAAAGGGDEAEHRHEGDDCGTGTRRATGPGGPLRLRWFELVPDGHCGVPPWSWSPDGGRCGTARPPTAGLSVTLVTDRPTLQTPRPGPQACGCRRSASRQGRCRLGLARGVTPVGGTTARPRGGRRSPWVGGSGTATPRARGADHATAEATPRRHRHQRPPRTGRCPRRPVRGRDCGGHDDARCGRRAGLDDRPRRLEQRGPRPGHGRGRRSAS